MTTSVCMFVLTISVTTLPAILAAEVEPRVVGGRLAKLGDFPSLVSIQRLNYKHLCGGTLINNLHVLTVAHCLFHYNGGYIPLHQFRIIAGDLSIASKSHGPYRIYRNVDLIFVHPKYNEDPYLNDICVLRLTELITNVDRVLYPTPLSDWTAREGQKCKLAGWGHVSELAPKMVTDLKKVEVSVMARAVCEQSYPDHFDFNTVFCAGAVSGGKDACIGDSGGGFFCENNMTGVIGYGTGCGRARYPGVYMNTTVYQKWIRSTFKYEGTQEDVPMPPFLRAAAGRGLTNNVIVISLVTTICVRS